MDEWTGESLGPTLGCVFPIIHPSKNSIFQFIFSVVADAGAGETKTHDRCQPWVFVKVSRSTNASGIAGYDDYQNGCLRCV
jgi:hypothetical protein